MVKGVARLGRTVKGVAQWVGQRPITEPAFPRLALSSWTAALASAPPVKRRVMITAFRNRTWIEWAVYATCQLRRLGVATTLVYSSAEIRRHYPLARVTGVEHLGFWAGVEGIADVRLVDLDDWKPSPAEVAPFRDFARSYAPTVAAYDLHVEENEEGPRERAYRRGVARAEKMLAETAAAMTRILGENPVARVVCYSGLIGPSPAICHAAQGLGVEVLTVEGWAWRPGHMICNLNAPALEYNLESWLRALGPWDTDREHGASRLLRFQEGAPSETTAPDDLHRAQRSTSLEPLPPALAAFVERPGPRFLMATNVVGDSSMLRRPSPFRSQRDWMRQVIERFRARPGWNLVVRAHPDEEFIRRKVAVRMGEVARELAQGAPNVFVVGGDEDASSYALMPGIAGGLVWISSIGADMVARGVPVLAAARPKYHELGIVEEPAGIDAYFAALESLAGTPATVAPEQRARAREYLSLVFQDFSFYAFSPTYRARDLFLSGPGSPPDADLFYRIVAGDAPPETPARPEARGVA
jgi:hypothetical protein